MKKPPNPRRKHNFEDKSTKQPVFQLKISEKWIKDRPTIIQNRASWRPKQGYPIGPVLGTILAAFWEPLGSVLEASWRGLGGL